MSSLISFLIGLDPVAYWIVGMIIVIFIAAVVMNISLRRKYSSLSNELESAKAGERNPFVSPVLKDIVDEYKKVYLTNKININTQAIIEEFFRRKMKGAMFRERFIKNSISLMIILGLFGTFLGLTLAVGELVNLLALSEGSDWLDILSSVGSGLIFSLQGMAVAFITSLFGIGLSIILTILNIILNVQEARGAILVEIESYLDNYVSADMEEEVEAEHKVLAKVIQNSMEEFASKIEMSLCAAVEGITRHMAEAAAGMEETASSLNDAVEKFDNSLTRFGENIRDLTEFNINLRNNIERMDVNFIKVTEAFQERRDKEITMIKMAQKLGEIEKLLQRKIAD